MLTNLSDTQAFITFFEFSSVLVRLLPAPPPPPPLLPVVEIVVVAMVVAGTGTSDLSECTRLRCEWKFPELATGKTNREN